MKIFNRRGGFRHKTSVYRSGLEDSLVEQLENAGIPVEYEKYYIPYTIPSKEHRYTPDFVLPNGIIVEGKGIFDATDRKKHLIIQQEYPSLDIRFVFSNLKTKIYPGSKTTVGDWCKQHGFMCAAKEIPAEWFKEGNKNTAGLRLKG